MTEKEARKLKNGEMVWAFNIGPCSEEDMSPTYCSVFAKPYGGYIRLCRYTKIAPFMVPVSNVFHTKEETRKAMKRALRKQIAVCKQDKKDLLAPIEDDLRMCEREISRYESMLAILVRQDPVEE